MASSASAPDNSMTPAVKVPMLPLLMVCVVAVVLAVAGCGGVMLFLVKSGKLGGGTNTVIVKEKVEAVATHPVVLEPMLVNLADEDGHSYLRVAITLAEADDDSKKKEGDAKPVPGANAPVRDVILDVLGKEHSPNLLDPAGKERLKQELKKELDEKVPDAHVEAVYFTDFLVQR